MTQFWTYINEIKDINGTSVDPDKDVNILMEDVNA